MHEQDMIALLQQHDERGMDALLLHCGPLMRYIIAPIVPNALDREECLSEASLRVWNKIAQFDAARGSWSAWLTAVTRNTAQTRYTGPAQQAERGHHPDESHIGVHLERVEESGRGRDCDSAFQFIG